MTDVIVRWRWFRVGWKRRTVLLVLAALFAILAIFPPRYSASVQLAPQDTSTAGLSSILSQLGGNYAALLGNQQPVEIDLAIGRSYDVTGEVARKLGMVDRPAQLRGAVQKLEHQTDIHALRGNIIEIVVNGHDPDFVLRASKAYAATMQDRLAQLSRAQTTYKRGVLEDRMREASDRLTRAEDAITAFRQQNRLVEPEAQLGAGVAQLTQLQGELQAKQVQLATALRFNAPQSYTVKSIQAEITALQAQVAQAKSGSAGSGASAASIAPKSLEYERLQRDLRFSQSLYDAYTRYLEGAALENLTADFNMQVLQPPFLETGIHFNAIPLALAVLLVLLAIASELYFFRPPVGAPLPIEYN